MQKLDNGDFIGAYNERSCAKITMKYETVNLKVHRKIVNLKIYSHFYLKEVE